jgi:2-(1,2-epoxy-1,2-dihydrophenyl)acetyl-CoA isomerase
MEDFGDLLYDVQNRIATITMNNPAKLNALTEPMRHGLMQAFQTASDDAGVYVVVITGAGRGFCSGADTSAPRGLADGPEPPEGMAPSIVDRTYNLRPIQRVARAVQQLDKPLIAAVNGPAAGAGMDMASMSDIRFASTTARFTQAFTRNAIIAGDGGAYFLPRIIGMARALELLWSSRVFGAEEALQLGYVSRVIEADRLLPETYAFAQELAEGPQTAIRYIKQLAYQSMYLDLDMSLRMAQYMQTIATATEDAQEARKAIREKRKANFPNR